MHEILRQVVQFISFSVTINHTCWSQHWLLVEIPHQQLWLDQAPVQQPVEFLLVPQVPIHVFINIILNEHLYVQESVMACFYISYCVKTTISDVTPTYLLLQRIWFIYGFFFAIMTSFNARNW